MEEDWEQLSNQEKLLLPAKKQDVNKWDGEDEEEEVKESWEDEDELEEKKDEEKVETPQPKPKKTVQEKIVEKEKQKQEEAERRKKETEVMTPEQMLAEKLRIQKLQEESDLKHAMETFGVTALAGGIDGMHPTTKEDFVELADAICKKLSNYKSNTEYPVFLEDLVTKLFASLPSHNIRKVKGAMDNLYLEKQKMEKGDKPKKSKAKVKAKLRLDGENTNFDEYATKYDYDDEYEDFM